jgi:hypothetical protein
MEYPGYGIYSKVKEQNGKDGKLKDTKIEIKPSCKQISLDAECVYDFILDKFENLKE